MKKILTVGILASTLTLNVFAEGTQQVQPVEPQPQVEQVQPVEQQPVGEQPALEPIQGEQQPAEQQLNQNYGDQLQPIEQQIHTPNSEVWDKDWQEEPKAKTKVTEPVMGTEQTVEELEPVEDNEPLEQPEEKTETEDEKMNPESAPKEKSGIIKKVIIGVVGVLVIGGIIFAVKKLTGKKKNQGLDFDDIGNNQKPMPKAKPLAKKPLVKKPLAKKPENNEEQPEAKPLAKKPLFKKPTNNEAESQPVEEVEEPVAEQPVRKPLAKKPVEEVTEEVEEQVDEKPARKPLRKPLVKNTEPENLFEDEISETPDVEFDNPEDLE